MRTKLIYIIGLWGCLSLFGCGDDDNLSPSDLDGDWYVLTDSEDPLDHLRYTVFQTYGVPVFYNDTIGSQNRGTDYAGLPIIYYEILSQRGYGGKRGLPPHHEVWSALRRDCQY